MQFGYTILYVKDVGPTASFYEKAFGLKLRFMADSQLYAEMETGQTALGFVSEDFMKASIQFQPNRPNEHAAGAQIAFVTDHVEKQFTHALACGAIEVLKPAPKPWGQIVACVRDNNGFL